ncbi:calcium-binding protein CML38-like [Olea europaea var. sylvestris]|uniref:calcium-binding protein CML38-like n=1 Tax=Olea europaea var. sylvestris TaxID=158386 RepID=UPI000C1D52E2|nr:calcium-binding protein CML38-like [Olea europaea var. sylvestris]
MKVKKGETAVPSLTRSYSSPGNGVENPQSSPKSAFQRLRQKLSPRKTASVDLKPSISSSDDKNGEAPEVDKWSENEMVFRYFDENGDGKISKEELRRCVRALGGEISEDEAEMVVQFSDSDSDGMLGLEDFTKLVEGGGEDERKDELKDAFKMYAMENSEFITPKSLKKMLNRLGNSTSMDHCASMISRFDINGDGVLSFDEFREMMR